MEKGETEKALDALGVDRVMELTQEVENKVAETEEVFDEDGNPTAKFTDEFIKMFAKELNIPEEQIRKEIADELGVPVENVVEEMINFDVNRRATRDDNTEFNVVPDTDVKPAVDITPEFDVPPIL